MNLISRIKCDPSSVVADQSIWKAIYLIYPHSIQVSSITPPSSGTPVKLKAQAKRKILSPVSPACPRLHTKSLFRSISVDCWLLTTCSKLSIFWMHEETTRYTGTVLTLDRGIEDRANVSSDRERGEKEAGAPAHKDVRVNIEATENGSHFTFRQIESRPEGACVPVLLLLLTPFLYKTLAVSMSSCSQNCSRTCRFSVYFACLIKI